jgi:hypothetical protein
MPPAWRDNHNQLLRPGPGFQASSSVVCTLRYHVGCLQGTINPGNLRVHGGCRWSRSTEVLTNAPSYTGQWG